MLRPALLRHPVSGPASAAASVRWLAEVVGPKDPAIAQAAREAASVTGAGEQGRRWGEGVRGLASALAAPQVLARMRLPSFPAPLYACSNLLRLPNCPSAAGESGLAAEQQA